MSIRGNNSLSPRERCYEVKADVLDSAVALFPERSDRRALAARATSSLAPRRERREDARFRRNGGCSVYLVAADRTAAGLLFVWEVNPVSHFAAIAAPTGMGRRRSKLGLSGATSRVVGGLNPREASRWMADQSADRSDPVAQSEPLSRQQVAEGGSS